VYENMFHTSRMKGSLYDIHTFMYEIHTSDFTVYVSSFPWGYNII